MRRACGGGSPGQAQWGASSVASERGALRQEDGQLLSVRAVPVARASIQGNVEAPAAKNA